MTSLLQPLWVASLWGSVAVLLVAAMRPLLRWLGGAGLVYRSWWLLPLSLVAPLLPVPALRLMEAAPAGVLGTALQAPVLPVDAELWPGLLAAVWLAGALAAAALQLRTQRRFERAMGRLARRTDGSWQASGDPGLPALVGVLRPRIVVGPDFDLRFSPAERDLILQHECSHRAHGDHWANLAVAVLRSLFWFHPLQVWAVRRFLHDQELACDARTVDPHPALRRLYAGALLKSQQACPAVPMACHWRSQPLLKERIAMLKQNRPKALSRMSGQVILLALCAGLATAAWASQGGATTTDVQVVDTAPPKYPVAALEQRLTGQVELRVEVGADGRVSDVRVLSATPAGVFDAAAVASARAWRFKPALREGRAVVSAVKIPVTFEMNDGASAP